MKKAICLILASVMLFAIAGFGKQTTSAFADSEQPEMEPKTLIFATQSVGTTSYVRVAAMADIIAPHMPEGWGIEAQPISAGGLASALMVECGETDIATSMNVSCKMLCDGGYADQGVADLENTRAIWGGTDYCYFLIMFTQKFQEKTGATTLEELFENKIPFRMVTKAIGSSGETGARELLEAMGYTYEDVEAMGGEAYHVDPNAMADMLKEDKADVFVDILSLGQPATTELTLTKDMFYVQLSDDTLTKIADYGYPGRVMPAGSWNGQDVDINTAVSCDSIVVRKDVPDDVVYAIAKAICEGKDELAKLVPSTASFDPSEACQPLVVGVALHPGAEQYYKDCGYLK